MGGDGLIDKAEYEQFKQQQADPLEAPWSMCEDRQVHYAADCPPAQLVQQQQQCSLPAQLGQQQQQWSPAQLVQQVRAQQPSPQGKPVRRSPSNTADIARKVAAKLAANPAPQRLALAGVSLASPRVPQPLASPRISTRGSK